MLAHSSVDLHGSIVSIKKIQRLHHKARETSVVLTIAVEGIICVGDGRTSSLLSCCRCQELVTLEGGLGLKFFHQHAEQILSWRRLVVMGRCKGGWCSCTVVVLIQNMRVV